jgi:hypothetical protein
MYEIELFAKGHIHRLYDQIQKKLDEQVLAIPNGAIPTLDFDRCANELVDSQALTCPAFDGDPEYDLPKYAPSEPVGNVTIYVPFTGDEVLWSYCNGNIPMFHVPFRIEGKRLVIKLSIDKRHTHTFKSQVDVILGRIQDALNGLAKELPRFHASLLPHVKSRLEKRRFDLAEHNKVLNGLARSGFRLRQRDEATIRNVVPVVLKPSVVKWSQAPRHISEPAISMQDYEQILERIRTMISVCERGPKSFAKLGEEDLRAVILVGLNGIFEGDATGETFNGEGKTDILIRRDNKNLFIAECLIWRGPEHFRKKLEGQLFRYATWRDSKLAAIVFNRQKGFTSVVDKMSEVAAALPNHIRVEPYSGATSSRHIMRRTDDAHKEFLLTCVAFNVPS